MLKHPDKVFIDGCWEAPSTNAKFILINPATEERFEAIAEGVAADMDRAVAAARVAFDSGPWRKLAPAVRGGEVRALAAALRERLNDAARIWTSEMGITFPMASALMHATFAIYDQYAELSETFAFEEPHPARWGGQSVLLIHEAVGVVAAIVPWNAPPLLIALKLAPALVAGCTVVLKASPEAAASAYLVAEAIEAIGLPPGVVNVLAADREVSELLVRNPDVDKVTFTGSTAAGRKIGAICGERLARCTLELGGKSAAIILDDFDVGDAAAALTASTPLMTGQVCAAITRVIIGRDRHDELVEALAEGLSKVRVGDPFAPDIDMGPLAMERQLKRVQHYIEAGKASGAQLATGGGRPVGLDKGFYIEPTVFGRVDNASLIAQEEIFGPVLSVIPADDEEQALAIANATSFGLNASVFTNDADRAYHVARELRTGTVGHNAPRSDFSVGFGGFKQSGIGREGGVAGLRSFLEPKTVVLDCDPPARPAAETLV